MQVMYELMDEIEALAAPAVLAVAPRGRLPP